jgi:hypothetical protein
MLMLFLITLGLIFWQRGQWLGTSLALIFSALVKSTGLILIPLFGIALLISADSWSARLKRGITLTLLFFALGLIFYRLMGPFPDVFEGARHATLNRRGYSPPYAVYVFVYWMWGSQFLKYILPTAQWIFVIYYLYLLYALAQKRIDLIQAGFAAFTGQLLLGTAFRIWYPLWLIPFAALNLNTRTHWRAFFFGLTAELSILSYFILWRWKLNKWDWSFSPPWDYFVVMTLLTVPWTFSIPFIPEWWDRWRNGKNDKLIV